jgi:hypothetical protein
MKLDYKNSALHWFNFTKSAYKEKVNYAQSTLREKAFLNEINPVPTTNTTRKQTIF